PTRAIDFGQLDNGNTHFINSVDLYNIDYTAITVSGHRPPQPRGRTAPFDCWVYLAPKKK
ncbi:MAG: hypothetical protein RRY42_00600, partial [Mucinivorans sp.]